jgi:hypothetical protein
VRDPKVRLRGLSEIATNSSRLILAEQFGCGWPKARPAGSVINPQLNNWRAA